ncbi:2-phosphosulfolactate phosphatase [Stella humosa]|uniref:Probable 2-phosphosulfolactate phosphatase n=1 Tax=Stella humosa TaxID=94 RepID=A0A3N1KXQ4_9PROT|nr:2-phosphosulfolactate phosphatase [Stella humosa]ROP83078.1 2-phosphosulfolactate phosphatase [Stella humosa]BBK30146.1 putative 2-phosphosulfolactate phosphatase [Stella humosa]
MVTIGSFADAARGASGTVVVIDVFRAFTTAAVALANGARRIVMVADLDEALALRAQGLGSRCLGERHGIRPDGFDFGNSPAEIADKRFDGETLIQTTSNGTRGVLLAKGAQRIYAGSFVSAEATVRAIQAAGPGPVTLVAMGETSESRADEDEICALYLRSRLAGRRPDPTALATLVATMALRADTVTLSAEDIDCCLRLDSVPFAIRVAIEDGRYIATAERPPG